jgi:polyisoprenoid-binding protein YceI
MLNRLNIVSVALLLVAVAAQADTYVPAPATAGKSGLSFSIPYTLGIHTGVATSATGELDIDPTSLTISGGQIAFPIADLESGNKERNCHMQEALGIDYAKSDYPKSHICAAADVLPPSGPNSVAFPEISFQFRSIANGKVTGTFSMHGVEKDLTVPVTVNALNGGNLRVQSTFQVHLPDFSVVVKKVLVVTVADDATVTVDLTLQPKASTAH